MGQRQFHSVTDVRHPRQPRAARPGLAPAEQALVARIAVDLQLTREADEMRGWASARAILGVETHRHWRRHHGGIAAWMGTSATEKTSPPAARERPPPSA